MGLFFVFGQLKNERIFLGLLIDQALHPIVSYFIYADIDLKSN